MAESRKVVVVGIPGVGKTSLLIKITEILKHQNKSVSLNSFGSIMFEVAKENGIKDRDELRKLPLSEQKNLQKIAAEKLAMLKDDVVIIDTHAFINSIEGCYPGLPDHVLQILKPSNFVSVSAKPEEIYNRRMKDTTRNRDNISIDNIKKELDIQSGMISACAVISGSPVKHVLNREGMIDEVADKIIKAIGL
ncbi:MAG: adenylate kinase [Nitrosarchaeum sp.]|nr:adenylate kinase [Nitrosarchaeum sp.]MBP0120596.1 adenylate kinase [Nitrosarchaeum sp.]MBP0133814.1 adenylate kinase [Nitrosarchaeum sp.]